MWGVDGREAAILRQAPSRPRSPVHLMRRVAPRSVGERPPPPRFSRDGPPPLRWTAGPPRFARYRRSRKAGLLGTWSDKPSPGTLPDAGSWPPSSPWRRCCSHTARRGTHAGGGGGGGGGWAPRRAEIRPCSHLAPPTRTPPNAPAVEFAACWSRRQYRKTSPRWLSSLMIGAPLPVEEAAMTLACLATASLGGRRPVAACSLSVHGSGPRPAGDCRAPSTTSRWGQHGEARRERQSHYVSRSMRGCCEDPIARVTNLGGGALGGRLTAQLDRAINFGRMSHASRSGRRYSSGLPVARTSRTWRTSLAGTGDSRADRREPHTRPRGDPAICQESAS